MNLYAEASDGALLVRLAEPRLDAAIAIQFKDLMREMLLQPSPLVVLDLSEVGFLDSSGLGAIVSVLKGLAPGRRLELRGLTPNVEKVFRLTRMDTIFSIQPGGPGARRSGTSFSTGFRPSRTRCAAPCALRWHVLPARSALTRQARWNWFWRR